MASASEYRCDRCQHDRVARRRPRRASWSPCISGSTDGTSADASSCWPTSAPSATPTTAHTHFIGSILSTKSPADDAAELVLIDGQQRITTLMLLVAALHHTVRAALTRHWLRSSSACSCADGDPTARSCVRTARGRRSSRASCSTAADAGDELRDSRFDDNYAFFRSQVRLAGGAAASGGGCRSSSTSPSPSARDANAQQIFESLNSTGEPLRDHELIHNYVLMGLSHAEQSEIEDAFWLPIEQNTGDAIGSFWRHYLVMTTGREVAVAGEQGVYDAFRHEFPRLDLGHAAAACGRSGGTTRRSTASCWTPRRRPDAGDRPPARIRQHLRAGMYPLVMRGYRDYARGA